MTEQNAIRTVFVMHSVLCVWKIIWWIVSWSIAVFSDWLQSWIDVLTTVIISIATKVNEKPADWEHQFGHTRAQPIAAFTVAILTWITWFEIIKYWIWKIASPEQIENPVKIIALMAVMTLSSWAISYITSKTGKANKNQSMIAMWQETLGDVFISLWAIIWIIWSMYWFLWLDPAMAIIIWIWIIKIWYNIWKENIGLIMGSVADKDQILEIENTIFDNFPNVNAIHDIRTQKLWTKIYAVIHCEINDNNFSFKEVHDIEESIQIKILWLDFIENVTVHLDYKNDSTISRIERKITN